MAMEDEQIEAAEEQGANGIPALMEGLQGSLDDNEEDVAESILDACLRMSSSSDVCGKLGEYLPSTLKNSLKIMLEEAPVIEVLFAVLVRVILSDKDQTAFASEDTVKLLMSAMSTHSEGEETLIEYSCLVIEKLAQDNESVQKMLIDNGAEDQLNKAESIITNVRNKKYVGQARTALKLA